MQNDDGTAQRVRDDDFAAMLAHLSDKAPLVTLAACQSAARSARVAHIGLKPQLAQSDILAVITHVGLRDRRYGAAVQRDAL